MSLRVFKIYGPFEDSRVKFELGYAITHTHYRALHPAVILAIEAFGEEIAQEHNSAIENHTDVR
jgi:hypothetical protein